MATDLVDLEHQIRANFGKVLGDPRFASGRLWLTLYISGNPVTLKALAEALIESGWINTSGEEGGFLYPKIEVNQELDEVRRIALQAQQRCDRHDVKLLHVDADTNAYVENSAFVTLFKA